MLILFDHVTPSGIARFLLAHTVTKVAAAVNAAKPGSYTEVEILSR
jgi:hypothetical protein